LKERKKGKKVLKSFGKLETLHNFAPRWNGRHNKAIRRKLDETFKKNTRLNLTIRCRFARGRRKVVKPIALKAQEFIENIEKEKQGRLRKLNFW